MFLYTKITKDFLTVTRKFPVNSNGLHGEVDVQLSPFGLLLLTQPLNSSEQHTRANLEFSSNFGFFDKPSYNRPIIILQCILMKDPL